MAEKPIIEVQGLTKRFKGLTAVHDVSFSVEKGSITIDGISLTVAAVDGEGFSVSTIPHTVAQTNLSQRRRGDPVNLETDVVGKYIEKLLRPEETKPHTPANESTLTKEMLLRCGF